MYKVNGLVILVFIELVSTTRPWIIQPKVGHRLHWELKPIKTSNDLCHACVDEAAQVINVVANLILDEGIFNTCSDLCVAVANKTGSETLGKTCKIVCDTFGYAEFIRLIMKSDIDPLYYCEVLKLCPIKDDGDAKFINFGVTPKKAPQNTEFIIDCSFVSINGTGTGSFAIDIVNPANESFGTNYFFEARPPGTYPERVGLLALSKLNCDPRDKLCSAWPLGIYNVTGRVCNGVCGSHHPHTSLYDIEKASFELIKKQDDFFIRNLS